MTAEPCEVEIVRLGAQGDGIAETAAGMRYVPFALPGERWRVGDGKLATRLSTHPARARPVCRHFESCGGCVAQHMPEPMYDTWKRGIVVQALGHRGLDAPVGSLVRVPLASRRRVTVYARRCRGHLHLGYHRAATHDIIDVRECPIAVPQIVAALPALREMLEPILSGQAEAGITLLATRAGVDVHIDFTRVDLGRDKIARLAASAARHALARLTVDGETIAVRGRPTVAFGGIDVEPTGPPFLQAVEAAEQEMTRIVLAAAANAKRVADLFCGLGTFTFPLARQARVLAADGDKAALGALAAAARKASGLKPIETKVRDLFREPLSTKELEGLDAVVFDPPRAGAKAQAAELARSKVPVVVAVSCDPGTLARDARILVDGGYRLDSVAPIDQFLFSAHVEAVAVFRR